MTSTFYLKHPKSKTETLILFSCYFKKEGKKFVYSTGENIRPLHWEQSHKSPKLRGKNKAVESSVIITQLNRYEDCFKAIRGRCIEMREDFTSQILKKAFDEVFKKAPTGKNIFFEAYDDFMADKIMNQEWTASTVKRYTNIKNILIDFEKDRNYKLTFSAITGKFYSEFTDYCMNFKGHINNTYSRNIGLLKTFMHWSLKNGFTYNEDFKEFKKKERVITNQIALKKNDIEAIMQLQFESSRLEHIRDVFVFACVTGMRFGELKLITRNSIIENTLHLKEEKGSEKEQRTIPINDIAMYLLRKYDFSLPIISLQKHNKYIKEVFKAAGYVQNVEKASTRGKEVIRETMPFYERTSSHTARRTFITMMKREGKSDKLIMKITGQKDIKTLNQYYQVEDEEKKEAVDEVFNIGIPLIRKID
ncbi:site-specific recombinase XerD [Ulvibacter sp. MAR_2010_11]|uniref:tyrosine-type recombinase/integrase n=1 Tax=Ulvibacter sp. MAR_2010_11 TaxID=1250229 RepID=UPI000C2CBC70|nr:tyrosine-type recombinase/integrase [Ulvibacter sp. MAR_2010_11]PKA83588.1 site-specific recombinase XerD [Ulvibacter sp. MAR_2010_11]